MSGADWKEYNKAWREANKDKRKEYGRQWREANKERRAAYSREWRAENSDHLSEYAKAYYAINKECLNAATKLWKLLNKERYALMTAAWRAKNKEYLYRRFKEYRIANKERLKEQFAAWLKNNPDKRKASHANRRARKRATGGTISRNCALRLRALQRNRCACCKNRLGKTQTHLDHIVPLALGGENSDANIQLLCQQCNQSKWAKHPIDFMRSRGFLC